MTSASQIDIGDPPHPTDREREIALQVGQTFVRSDRSTPSLLTAMARALAAYRVELEQRGAREAAYQLVESDLRDKRVCHVVFRGSCIGVDRRDGTEIRRASSDDTLLQAVELLDHPERTTEEESYDRG